MQSIEYETRRVPSPFQVQHIKAFEGNKEVAYLDYFKQEDGTVVIEGIKVGEDHLRKGVATSLIRDFCQLFGSGTDIEAAVSNTETINQLNNLKTNQFQKARSPRNGKDNRTRDIKQVSNCPAVAKGRDRSARIYHRI